jgi:hypothetical protein
MRGMQPELIIVGSGQRKGTGPSVESSASTAGSLGIVLKEFIVTIVLIKDRIKI